MKEFSTGGTAMEVTPNMSILHLDGEALYRYKLVMFEVTLQQKIYFATGD